MSSSPRSAGTDLIGLLRNNEAFEDDLSRPSQPQQRRSSLDSLHALAAFLPDDLLCDQEDDNIAATAFGSSDPLLDMPIMTIDIDNTSNYNASTAEDKHFESILSEPANYTSAIPSRAQKDKPKRRASTDAFVNFHRMMGTSASTDEEYGATRHDSMSSFTTASESISSTTGTGTTATTPNGRSSAQVAHMAEGQRLGSDGGLPVAGAAAATVATAGTVAISVVVMMVIVFSGVVW